FVTLTQLFLRTFSRFFFFIAPAPSEIYTLSLHDALPICAGAAGMNFGLDPVIHAPKRLAMMALLSHSHDADFTFVRDTLQVSDRSEEHTSELQSRFDLVCRLLLEKKKKKP